MRQVEIFSRSDVIKLQTQLNEYLESIQNDGKNVIDIKFTSSETEEREPVYAALVIYEAKS